MATHMLTLPATRDQIQALAIGDIIYLTGRTVSTGGLPTHQRMVEYIDAGKPLPVAIDSTFLHLPGSFQEDAVGIPPVYVNPTTSTRFNAQMPRIIRHFNLRITGGKGGLDQACVDAMRETGCVYLSMLGGGSPVLTAAVSEVLEMAWTDLPMHFRLMALQLDRLGPLIVGIDAHGNSVFDQLTRNAIARLPAIREELARRRAEPEG